MLLKMTYPTRQDLGDEYHEVSQISFTGTLVDDRVAFTTGSGRDPIYLDPRGLEIYVLDSYTGKTIDRAKWTVAKYV